MISLSALKEQGTYVPAAKDQYESIKKAIAENAILKLEDYVHPSIRTADSFENYIGQNEETQTSLQNKL
jgi:hypothetical protein